MVPEVRLDAANNEILRGNAEIQRLQRSIQNMVSTEVVRRAEDKAAVLTTELAHLRSALDGMVPSSRHIALQKELQRTAAERQRLFALLDSMVPREQFLACKARADQVGTYSMSVWYCD